MRKILNHKYGVEVILLGLTILKIIVVYFFFQNLVVFVNGIPEIAPGYAWSELVINMQNGEYFNTSQYSLSEMYDMKFHALRPPLYGTFLFLLTYLGSIAGIVGVIVQSISTSLIAYFSYRIIKMESVKKIVPFITLLFVFFLPFNFFKSGSLDDAVFMLLFLLVGIYCLLKAVEKSKFNSQYVLSGIFFGLALLSRSAALFVLFAAVIYVILKFRKNYIGLFTMVIVVALVVSPWIIRNYLVIGKPVHTNGRGRVMLLMQSKEFIDNFPYKSIDVIDREYFIKNHKKYKYINQLAEKDKDSEFLRLAIEEAKENPLNVFKSLITKSKVFIPLDYYPLRGDWAKTLVYLLSYWLAVILFFIGLIVKKKPDYKPSISILVIFAIICFSSVGFIGFMLSRHFYALIVLLFISSGISFSNSRIKLLASD